MFTTFRNLYDSKINNDSIDQQRKRQKWIEANMFSKIFCDALHNLVLFVQFKKREKHQCRSATFSKVAGFGLQLY